MSRGAARHEAFKKRFGNTTLLKEDTREMDIVAGWTKPHAIFATHCGMLHRNPGLPSSLSSRLALGIGANRDFSPSSNSVLLQPSLLITIRTLGDGLGKHSQKPIAS